MEQQSRSRQRGESLRRELQSFLWLASFWGILTNLFAGVIAIGFQNAVQDFASRNPQLFWLLCLAGFVALLYFAAVFLHRGIAATLRDQARWNVVVPVIIHNDRVEVAQIPDYAPSLELSRHFAKATNQTELLGSFHDAATVARGNPFRGELHAAIIRALLQAAAGNIAETNRGLFARTGDFRAVHYDLLRPETGTFRQAGFPDRRLLIPHGVSLTTRSYSPQDAYKQNHDLVLEGEFGHVQLRIWSEWAVLSESYWSRSFAHVAGELKGRFNEHRSVNFLPSLWLLKIPVDISIEFENSFRPWHFMTARFEQESAWIDEVNDGLVSGLAWETFERERLER